VKYFINNSLYIENSENRGRGIFTSSELPEGLIIEHSPVLESYITKWREEPKTPSSIISKAARNSSLPEHLNSQKTGKSYSTFTEVKPGKFENSESTRGLPVAPYELKKYIFSYPYNSGRYVIGWGYLSLYNHADDNNAMWYVDETKPNNGIYIKTLKKIMPGEEVFVHYGPAYWSSGWKKY